MNDIHQRLAMFWLLINQSAATTFVPVTRSWRHLLSFPKINKILSRLSNPPATGIWLIKEKTRYRSEYSFKKPTCLPSMSTILTFIILLSIVCPWLARSDPFKMRNRLCPTKKTIKFSFKDSGIPFIARGRKWSQNPVTIAIPIRIGMIIIESIITAPKRDPLPANELTCSLILFFSIIMCLMIVIPPLMFYYNLRVFL